MSIAGIGRSLGRKLLEVSILAILIDLWSFHHPAVPWYRTPLEEFALCAVTLLRFPRIVEGFPRVLQVLSDTRIFRLSRTLVREFFPFLFLLVSVALCRAVIAFRPETWRLAAFRLIVLTALIALRFTAPPSRTLDQINWFFSLEIGGLCLLAGLSHFALYADRVAALQIAVELSFWFCLFHVCRISRESFGKIWAFVLFLAYVVHISIQTGFPVEIIMALVLLVPLLMVAVFVDGIRRSNAQARRATAA